MEPDQSTFQLECPSFAWFSIFKVEIVIRLRRIAERSSSPAGQRDDVNELDVLASLLFLIGSTLCGVVGYHVRL
jgi:hypothetical protein